MGVRARIFVYLYNNDGGVDVVDDGDGGGGD